MYCQKFFNSFSQFVAQEACDQGRAYLIGHNKRSLRKSYSISFYSQHAQHMTNLFKITSIPGIQKSQETARNS